MPVVPWTPGNMQSRHAPLEPHTNRDGIFFCILVILPYLNISDFLWIIMFLPFCFLPLQLSCSCPSVRRFRTFILLSLHKDHVLLIYLAHMGVTIAINVCHNTLLKVLIYTHHVCISIIQNSKLTEVFHLEWGWTHTDTCVDTHRHMRAHTDACTHTHTNTHRVFGTSLPWPDCYFCTGALLLSV